VGFENTLTKTSQIREKGAPRKTGGKKVVTEETSVLERGRDGRDPLALEKEGEHRIQEEDDA